MNVLLYGHRATVLSRASRVVFDPRDAAARTQHHAIEVLIFAVQALSGMTGSVFKVTTYPII